MDMACSTTFENLGDGYGVDAHSAFYKGNKIPNADPETFEKLNWAYSKDTKNVYLFTCQLESARPNEFEILGGSWSKDKENVYHGYHLWSARVENIHK